MPVTIIAIAVALSSLWALSDVIPSGGIWTMIKLAFGLGVFKASEWACNMAFAAYAMFVLLHRGITKCKLQMISTEPSYLEADAFDSGRFA